MSAISKKMHYLCKMIEPKHIQIANYTYDLPHNRIAKYPKANRDESKLLVYKKGSIFDSSFNNIQQFIPADTIIVSNNSRVIPARILFKKETGAVIEIFCLEPMQPSDYQSNFAQTQSCVWKCIVGNRRKWKEGCLVLTFDYELPLKADQKTCSIEFKAEIIKNTREDLWIAFSWNSTELCFSQIIECVGALPIPPYLERGTETSDYTQYQTIYSKIEGSVAAPTAGLHFTENIITNLQKKGTQFLELTLHVGAGTFKPVKTKTIGDHEMHGEHFSITRSTIEKLCSNSNIIAVGTTTARTLESLYWIGVSLIQNKHTCIDGMFYVEQWQPYNNETSISKNESYGAIVDYLEKHEQNVIHCKTSIIIVPGYRFKVIHQLLTNFHQPHSTLILLVAAFVGEQWKNIYNHALENEYRFLSYGDSSLLFGQ